MAVATVGVAVPTAEASPVGAVITSPTDGASGVDVYEKITWTAVDGADGYALRLGTSVGANDLLATPDIHATSFTISSLPPSSTIYAELTTITGSSRTHTFSTFSTGVLVPSFSGTGTSGPAGGTFTCTGRELPPNTGLTVLMGTAYDTAVTTNAIGAFKATCNVAYLPTAAVGLTLTDYHGISLSLPFTVLPVVRLSATTLSPGATVTATAAGFAADSTLASTFNGAALTTDPTAPATDGTGNATFTFVVPAVPNNNPSALVTTDGAADSATTALKVYATQLHASATSGAPGSTFHCYGSLFPPNHDLTVHVGSAYVTELTTSATGTFSATCTVPNIPAGAQGYSVTDYGLVTAGLPFAVVPGLAVTPKVVAPSATVTVTAAGFAASSVLTATINGATATTSPAVVTTDASGDATFTITAPGVGASADSSLVVTDAASNSATHAVKIYNVQLRTSISAGTPGTTFTCSGKQFPPNTALTVHIGPSYVTDLTTDASGSFSTTCTVPSTPGGAVGFSVTNYSTITASLPFTVQPVVVLYQTSMGSGGTVNLEVDGFAASSQLTVRIPGTGLVTTPQPVLTNAAGAVTFSFAVPASTSPGTYLVKVTDAAGDHADASLTVTG